MTKDQFRKALLSPIKLKVFLLQRLPMAALAGLRLISFECGMAEVLVKYGYWTKNPFRSIYFAVLAMAAELSTGVLVYYHTQFKKRKVSILVTNLEAEYYKKAKGRVRFVCDLSEVNGFFNDLENELEEGFEAKLTSRGFNEKNELVAECALTWSMKYK